MSATRPAATPSGPAPVRRVHGTPLAWEVELEERDRSQETRFPELFAFACLAVPAVTVPHLGLPLNETAMAAVSLIALTRRPQGGADVPRWFTGGLASVLLLLAATSALHHLTPERRLLHVVLYCSLALLIASGRLHALSAARGITIGLALSVAGSLAGLMPQGYDGRLAGLFGDPNNAGYVLTTLGVAAYGTLHGRGLARFLVPLVPAAVVLTYSRTALLALALAVLWGLFGRRVGRVVGVAAVGITVWLVSSIPQELRLFGPFSDRTGSDALRDRIIAQERIEIHASPWFGSGAGTARVQVDANTFFYHSSYFALQREGGLVTLGVLLLLVAVLAWRNLHLLGSLRNPWLEAGVICGLVCAVNLGEVLLELPMAVAIGMLAHHLVRARATTPEVAT